MPTGFKIVLEDEYGKVQERFPTTLSARLLLDCSEKNKDAHAAIPCFLSHEQQESKLGQQTVTFCISVDVFQKKTLDKLSSLVTSLWSEAWHKECWNWK